MTFVLYSKTFLSITDHILHLCVSTRMEKYMCVYEMVTSDTKFHNSEFLDANLF